MSEEKLQWTRGSDGSYGAGVKIGGDLARQWKIIRGPDRRWRAYFHYLDTTIFIGAATAKLSEQQRRVEAAAALFQHRSYP